MRQKTMALELDQTRMPTTDWWLLVSALALLSFSIVMVGSASMHLGERIAGNPFYHLQKHIIAIILGLFGGYITLHIHTKVWQKTAIYLYILGVILIAIVLIPGIGRSANGATRWIPIAGFNLQTSEFMKFFVVIYLADYLVRRQKEVVLSVWGFIKPMIMLIIVAGLLMLQPDFGTTALIMMTAMGLLFLGGVPLIHFGLLIGSALLAAIALVIASPYRLKRVMNFIDPWADPQGAGYQLSQALIAFGRGEWFGVGLGHGIQKQFYLPEAHTDFIMAVIGEEFGFVGSVMIILLFMLIVLRAFRIGAKAEAVGNQFSAFVAYGLGLGFGLQAFINIGVNVGLLPTKGLTLPLVSYGGNSIIVGCLIIAVLLRINYETSLVKPKEKVSWLRM